MVDCSESCRQYKIKVVNVGVEYGPVVFVH